MDLRYNSNGLYEIVATPFVGVGVSQLPYLLDTV
jgi:hypothetical protein